MAQVALLNDELEAGRRMIEELRATGFEVVAAFWARLADDNAWNLYLASPAVEKQGRDAYLKVYATIDRMPELGLDSYDVKLLRTDDAMAKAAQEAVQAKPEFTGITRFRGTSLGVVSVDGAYIYPQPQSVPTA